MSLGATLHPLGIPPLLLGGILIAAGLVLLAHFVWRIRGHQTGRPRSRSQRLAEALVAPRRLRVTSKAPFLRFERTGERWTIAAIDAELYWAAALIIAGIGALLALAG